jgi:hypothetical protein
MKFYEKLFSQIFTEASTNNLNKWKEVKWIIKN